MKKQVTDFVKSLGGQTAYSGNKKTMYVSSTRFKFVPDLEQKVIDKFGYNLPFKLAS